MRKTIAILSLVSISSTAYTAGEAKDAFGNENWKVSSAVISSDSKPTAIIEEQAYYLIPEILDMRDRETVPSEIYIKYDSRLIAASLVYRLHESREQQDNAFAPETDFKTRTVIQMRFPPELISSIAQKGFLNQHQLEHARGDVRRLGRAQTEDRMIGVRLENDYVESFENPVNFVRPKYAFLGFDRDANGEQHSAMENSRYGGAVAVFKDDVKNRATFAPQDTLGTSGRSTRTFNYRSTERLALVDSFWEAQIWGKLTLSDVAYLLIDCPNEPKTPDTMLNSIKATGLPIYKCEYAKDHSHIERGKRIYKGNVSALPTSASIEGTDTSKLRVEP